jgi:hypothetical protein
VFDGDQNEGLAAADFLSYREVLGDTLMTVGTDTVPLRDCGYFTLCFICTSEEK